MSKGSVSHRDVDKCLRDGDLDKLREVLDRLKTFSAPEYTAILWYVLDEMPDAKRPEALDLLLRWPNGKVDPFVFLSQAVKNAGLGEDGELGIEDEPLDPVNFEPVSGDVTRYDRLQALDQLSERPYWRKNRGYAVAERLLEAYPNLCMNTNSAMRTVYHVAAQFNAPAVIILAAEIAEKHDLSDHAAAAVNQKDKQGATPLSRAVHDNYPLVVQALIKAFPSIEISSKVLRNAVENDKTAMVDILGMHRPELIGAEELKKSIESASLNTLKSLIKNLSERFRSEVSSEEQGNAPIEGANSQGIARKKFEHFCISSKILHHAVSEGKHEIVTELVEQFPCLVTASENWEPVLHYNTSSMRQEIRNIIIPKLIGSNLSPKQIREHLSREGHRREIALDLSAGKVSPESLERFIEQLRLNSQLHPKNEDDLYAPSLASVEYETYLRYVDLPIPEYAALTRYMDQGRREDAKLVFDWLAEEKCVTRIREIRVRDSRYHPTSEELIQSCLERFNVEVFDWRRPDISIDCVVKTAPCVKELHLYSSGTWASLSHWTSEMGVGRLKQLERLQIAIMKDDISKEQARNYQRNAREALDSLKRSNNYRWTFAVDSVSWIEVKPDKQTVLEETEALRPAMATQLSGFLEGYRSLQRDFQRNPHEYPNIGHDISPKVRVAIIDTGIDETLLDETFRGLTGASFVSNPGTESPWYLARELHGTQMAWIIRDIDPYCDIFMAKVGDAIDDIMPERVAEAIRWAILQKVDIISMSFCVPTPTTDLRNAVNDALSDDIVVFASTSDDGNRNPQHWLKQCEGVNAIAACSSLGKWTDFSSERDVTFALQGVDITVDLPCAKPTGPSVIKGSSVATAMAAGVGSLILACQRFAFEQKKFADVPNSRFSRHRRDTVKEVMDRMTGDKRDKKFVMPWKVLEHSKQATEPRQVMNQIRYIFAPFDPSQRPIRRQTT